MVSMDINGTVPNLQAVSLHDLNEEEVIRRLPSLIYLAILIVIGLPGNISVLAIFSKHYKESTYRTFMLVLAALDTISCAVCIPFEITETRFQYTFYNAVACKIFRTNNAIISVSSIFVLLALSVDRFRHVCQPLRVQMSVKSARITCGVSIGTVFIISVPNMFFSGIRHVTLKNNITGFDCSFSDEYSDTVYPVYYNGLLFLLFIAAILSLIILYTMIGRKVFRHSKARKKLVTFKGNSSSSEASANTVSTSASDTKESNRTNQAVKLKMKEISSTVGNEDEMSKENISLATSNREKGNKNKSFHDRKWKITKVAFAITVLFIISYLPFLILSTMTAVKGSFLVKPGPLASGLLPIVTRSIFINNVGNPIIYGFIDEKFRGHLRSAISFKKCE